MKKLAVLLACLMISGAPMVYAKCKDCDHKHEHKDGEECDCKSGKDMKGKMGKMKGKMKHAEHHGEEAKKEEGEEKKEETK